MDHAAVVPFDTGANLGLGAAGQDGTIAIDQVVVADLAPAAFFAVPAVDLFALGGKWLTAHPVGVRGRTMDDDLFDGVAGAALEDQRCTSGRARWPGLPAIRRWPARPAAR